MTPGLGEHTLARIDENHGKARSGSASDHVARVLLVAWGVGHDELTLLGRKESIRHIDGDALLALGRQAIDQQCKVEFAALRAHFLRVGLKRCEVIFEHQL